MLYQALVSAGLLTLLVVYRQSFRHGMHGGGLAFAALATCAIVYVLSGYYPSADAHAATIARSCELLTFVMLFPLLFINIKRFANLALPHWRGLRAFSIGVPFVVGVDGVVDSLQAVSTQAFPAHIWWRTALA